jgi:hypothetical protein
LSRGIAAIDHQFGYISDPDKQDWGPAVPGVLILRTSPQFQAPMNGG